MTRTAKYIAAGAALALVVSIASLISASDSEAIVTFTVNSTVDSPDADPGDGTCQSEAGGCTLRAAIMETNALPGMDIVDVPAGLYLLTLAGASEDDSATGDLDILDDVKIDGASGVAVIGGSNNVAITDRVFDIDPKGDDLNVQIYDIRVQYGRAPNGQDGSGIYSSNPLTFLHVERTFFENNAAPDQSGGGLYNASQLTMVNTEFRTNSAEFGGGMMQDSPFSASLTNVTFTENTAEVDGGGLYLDTGPISLANGNFLKNIAGGDGAGAYLLDNLSMSGGTFVDNVTGAPAILSISGGGPPPSSGGAIYNGGLASTTVSNVTFDDNIADFGGGLYNHADMAITDTTIMSNFANIDGGGILNSGFGIVDLENVTVSGNEAVENGGGIANYGDLVQANNATVTLNTADFNQVGAGEGGGVYNDPAFTVDMLISNTIIGNNNFPISSFDCWGTLLSGGHNLIGNTTGCNISGLGTGNILNQHPNLVDLQNNGGSTLTHLPAAFSPAIDNGSPVSILGLGTIACEPIDQRGVTRPRDGDGNGSAICDIGAVEVSGPGPTATPFGTPAPTGSPTPTPSPTPSVTDTPTATPIVTTSPTPTPSPTPSEFNVIWADSNCANGVEPTDALIVLRADAGLSVNQSAPCVGMGESAEFDGIQRTWGDFDCNDALSPVDALKILQYDSGFEPAQAAGCPEFGDVVTVT